MKNKPAGVLYSGGADSTLAACLMLQDYYPLHLLSFKHHRMSQMDKTTQAARRLREHFGKDAIIHRWIDMTPLWRKINKEPPFVSLRRKGVFALLLKPCLGCKAAMHLLTLSYCIKQRIAVVADGAHPAGAALFPEQLQEGIDVLREFYRRFNISYKNPVYQVEKPDAELFGRGITTKKNTKNEHLYYSNQFACHVGLLAYIYHFVTLPFDKNKKRTIRLTLDFFKRCLREELIPGL